MYPATRFQGYSGSMRIDLYTKAVFTVIAIMLTVVASNRLTKIGQPMVVEK
jgi:hypothetical protein